MDPMATPMSAALSEYLRLIDSGITQLKAQGPSRTCNESTEEEEKEFGGMDPTATPMSAALSAGPSHTTPSTHTTRHTTP